MNPINAYLRQQLQHREATNSLRQLPSLGRGIDFCSNDYLGFARESLPFDDPTQFGATGSRLISGNHSEYGKLEDLLCNFFQSEAALVYGSGYQANLGLLSCIATRHDTIIYDQLAHASIRDALRLSNARTFAFRHNDMTHLREKLEQAGGRIFVIVESIYSMDGDEAPLDAIQRHCASAGAALIVDEAHAVGVIGREGRGLTAELVLNERIWARIITFGKAIGSHGAAVLGSNLLRDYLINFSRPFIYTTGLPPGQLHRITEVFKCLSDTERIARLQSNINYFRSGLQPQALARLLPSRSAIQCLLVPGNEAVKAMAEQLQGEGLDILPILHPTVPEGAERLRICLHAFNRRAEIDQLVATLNRLLL